MSKKALTLIVGLAAFTFVAVAIYAATNTSSTPTNNTSVTNAQVCDKNCAKDCDNCDKYEDCNCKCKDCDGDCENCDKDCCADCKNSESCNKPCKGSGDGLCSFLAEEMGSCQKSQECGGCSGH